jgi:hypothetical protein
LAARPTGSTDWAATGNVLRFEFPVFYDGQVDTFEPGAVLFADRDHTASDDLPTFLNGMHFVRSNWNGTGLKSLDSGVVYALVRADNTIIQSELAEMGFSQSSISDFQLFGTTGIGNVSVYQKNVNKGDEICFSRAYGVLLSPRAIVLASPQISTKTERLYNGIILPSDPRARTNLLAYGYDPTPVPYLENPPQVIPIDVGRQLFVDDFLIDMTTLTRTYHKPTKYEGNPVLKPETELENQRGIPLAAPKSGGLWWDPQDQRFKVWYEAGWLGNMAYAESKDGIDWHRPELDFIPGTNAILRDFRPDSTTVFLDHDAKDPNQRFKMFLREPLGDVRPAYVTTSPDGIHWAEPIETGGLGDRSSMFYNPFRKKWVYSIRRAGRYPTPYGRARYYREHEDYLAGARWFDTDLAYWASADDLDVADPELGERPQLYNLDAVAYESLMIGYHQIHLGPTNLDCAAEGIPKITELKLSYSRDGFHWHRPDREPFIPETRHKHDWDRGYVQSVGGICTIMGDELWFYYIGFQGDTEKIYSTYPDWLYLGGMHANASTGIARLRRDGFVSMDAGGRTGTLTTRPITFSKGDRLFVNVNTPDGRLRVEVLDADGRVIEGLSVTDSVPVSVDSTLEEIRWNSHKSLAGLQNQPIRLRFHLTNGQLYAFWVSDASGASHGYVAAGGPGYTSGVDTVGRAARDVAKQWMANE